MERARETRRESAVREDDGVRRKCSWPANGGEQRVGSSPQGIVWWEDNRTCGHGCVAWPTVRATAIAPGIAERSPPRPGDHPRVRLALEHAALVLDLDPVIGVRHPVLALDDRLPQPGQFGIEFDEILLVGRDIVLGKDRVSGTFCYA